MVRVNVANASVDAFAAVSADFGGSPRCLPKQFSFVSLKISLIISLVISLIPLWTAAAFTGFTAITTTFLSKEQSIWREPFLSLDWRLLFDELGDDLVAGGGHRGVFVHHELQEDFLLLVPWDSAKEVEDVLLLTDLCDCLCIVRIGISVGGRWPCAEVVIFDFPMDPRWLIVDISVVL